MRKVGKTWTLAAAAIAGALCAGCRAPLSAWDRDARARGGFIVGGGMVMPKDAAQDDATSTEVSGFYQHTPHFATEYATGSWTSDEATYPTSKLACDYSAITFLYTADFADNWRFRIGGGLTVAGAHYTPGYAEQAALGGLGIDDASTSIDATAGAHFQIDIAYVARNGFTLGLLARSTSAEADATLTYNDGALQTATTTVDLGNTMAGFYVGATF